MNEPLRPASPDDALPLSPTQLRFWVGQRVEPDAPLYNMALASTIDGPLDPERLLRAWAGLVEAFPVLRTTVDEDADGLAFQHRAARAARAERIDLSAASDPEAAARGWANARAARRLVPEKSLVDVALLRLAPERWVWYCNQHHLITDAGSMAVLWQALARRYFAAPDTEGPAVADAGAETPAADFTAYLRRQREAPPSSAARAHWRERADAVSRSLPRPPGAVPSTRSTRHRLALCARRREALAALAARPAARGLTPSMGLHHALLALLSALLCRLGGGRSPSIGAPASNRGETRFAGTVGSLVELLPMRIDIDLAESFDTLLERARAESMRFLRNVSPGACEALSGDATLAVLNHVVARCGPFGPWPARTEWLHPGHSDRHHAARLHATDWDGTGAIALDLDLNHGWFPPGREGDALALWWRLFDAVTAEPRRPLAELLSVVDAPPAAPGGAATSEPAPNVPDRAGTRARAWSSVVEGIGRSCARHPQEVAVACGERTLSYAALDAQSRRVAAALRARGIGPGDRVCLRLRRELHLPGVILGVLRAGAAYVPIDVAQPEARARSIIADAEPRLLISDRTLGGDAASPGAPVPSASIRDANGAVATVDVTALIGADIGTNAADEDGASDATAPPAPGALAYLLYTSGSTGRPKGVMVSHAALANYCRWASAFYAGDARPSFPLFTPLGFDLTVTSLFVPLLAGGSLRVYPEAAGPIDLGVRQVFEDDAVDVVKLTPAHLALIEDMDLSRSRVAQLIVGGEDLKTALARRIVERFGGAVRIHNEYGPTEATVGCIVHTFDPGRDRDVSVPIGVAVAGTRAQVLDERGTAVGDGEAGELYLAGPSLAEGYWRRPDATASAFLEADAGDSAASGGRRYRTGDRVRRAADGKLFYLGRLDDQVQLDGARIELGEIESVLSAHPAVRQCAARLVGGEGGDGDERHCLLCGLSSRHPEAHIGADGRCRLCRRFERYRDRAADYFRPFDELEAFAGRIRAGASDAPHCMMLLSGGKDSSYALARLVDLGLSVLAYTLDNGYISDQAKGNVERVCAALGVEQVYGTTPHMGPIFKDSLERHANVCNGCFKTLYTLSMKLARERGIGWIFTGLSRGQFFETRLTEELFTDPDCDVAGIDRTVLGARKAYHRVEDATTRLLDTHHLADERIFDEIRFVDFYRYCSVTLEEMLAYLDDRLPWIRPEDTGRSSNCLINDVGIHVHRLERGYHNYALPYSWDVRLGHKTREAALEELDDAIDEARVERILGDIGYNVKRARGGRRRLALYYVADDALSPEDARAWLAARLPAPMVPAQLVPLPALPLSANGKVRRDALPPPAEPAPTPRAASAPRPVAPKTPLEEELLRLWRELLGAATVGVDDDFFALGGDSLLAVRLVARLRAAGRRCATTDLFEHPSVAALAAAIERRGEEAVAAGTDANATATPERFASLDARQRQRLAALLERRARTPSE